MPGENQTGHEAQFFLKSFSEIQQVDHLIKKKRKVEKSLLSPKVSIPILFGLQKNIAGKRADLACMETPFGKPGPCSLT